MPDSAGPLLYLTEVPGDNTRKDADINQERHTSGAFDRIGGSKFNKYSERGAYHWSAVPAATSLLRYNPYLHSRYIAPLRLARLAAGSVGGTVLDIGCGDGVMLYELERIGATGIGLDMEADGLALSARKLKAHNVPRPQLVCGDAEGLPIATGTCDFVFALEVIEHLNNVEAFLGEVRRILKPGGWFVVTTPQAKPSREITEPYHVREYLPDELRKALRPYFDGVDLVGAWPRSLERLYLRPTGWAPLDRVLRLVMKLPIRYLWNPFASITTRNLTPNWTLLIAICR